MATVTTIAPVAQRPSQASRVDARQGLFVGGCTALAFLLLGYHPFAEDGGIYAAAAALRLDPSLFPADRAFAIGQTSRSLFVPLLSAITHALHLPLPVMLLLLHLLALAATIAAAALLGSEIFAETREQRWAVLTLAVSLGVPVAGTSLYLSDPYLTPRSLSTPLILLATTAILKRRWLTAALCLAVAFAFHPLMAVWASVLLFALVARQSSRPFLYSFAAAATVLAGMGIVQYFSPAESPAAHAAALSRSYWFLSQWSFPELIGLVAPAPLMMWLTRRTPITRLDRNARDIVIAVVAALATVTIGSILFVHENNAGMLLARIQPMRLLQPVYLLLPLFLGGYLAQSRWKAAWIALPVAGASLVAMQVFTYPASGSFELPGTAASNAWVQAFEWVGAHTHANALFALDANYTTATGEDAQNFRAIAHRSHLPDAAKDGGISSVMPALAAQWHQASTAQTGLNEATDTVRLARVRPLGATWIVLPVSATTAFTCPYANQAAKVCQLP